MWKITGVVLLIIISIVPGVILGAIFGAIYAPIKVFNFLNGEGFNESPEYVDEI